MTACGTTKRTITKTETVTVEVPVRQNIPDNLLALPAKCPGYGEVITIDSMKNFCNCLISENKILRAKITDIQALQED